MVIFIYLITSFVSEKTDPAGTPPIAKLILSRKVMGNREAAAVPS